MNIIQLITLKLYKSNFLVITTRSITVRAPLYSQESKEPTEFYYV